jgi:hypothetical protein
VRDDLLVRGGGQDAVDVVVEGPRVDVEVGRPFEGDTIAAIQATRRRAVSRSVSRKTPTVPTDATATCSVCDTAATSPLKARVAQRNSG